MSESATVHQTIQGAFRQTNLTNESAEYLARREELRLAEVELMRQRERVAELRRHLPPGPVLQDYRFIEGPADLNSGDTPTRTVRLSELFTATDRPLVIASSIRVHPWMSPEIKERGIDLLSPIWHVLDLTPQGRGDWYTKLEYPMRSHAWYKGGAGGSACLAQAKRPAPPGQALSIGVSAPFGVPIPVPDSLSHERQFHFLAQRR